MSLTRRIGELESRVASLPARNWRADLEKLSTDELRQLRELCIKSGGAEGISKLSDDDLILLEQLTNKTEVTA